MAYSGTTASSTLRNPPRCVAGNALSGVPGATTGLSTAPDSPNNQGGSLWSYVSTNKTTDYTAANFFSDGLALGMRPGDVMHAVQFTSAGSSAIFTVGVVTGVSTSGVSLALGSHISSTYS